MLWRPTIETQLKKVVILIPDTFTWPVDTFMTMDFLKGWRLLRHQVSIGLLKSWTTYAIETYY